MEGVCDVSAPLLHLQQLRLKLQLQQTHKIYFNERKRQSDLSGQTRQHNASQFLVFLWKKLLKGKTPLNCCFILVTIDLSIETISSKKKKLKTK